MKLPATKIATALALILMTLLTPADLLSQDQHQRGQYAAMEGVTDAKVVFDFRVGDADAALAHLDLIHSMLNEPSMNREGASPDIAVVFIGPSVNLISTERTEGDQGPRSRIAEKIAAMEAEGVTFEVCMTAAHAHDVSAESILPEVDRVGNGWISLVGYQHNDYAVISDF